MLVRSDLITSTLPTPVTSLRGAASAETDGPALATAEVPSTIVSNSTALEAHAASWTYMAPTRYVPASMQAWQSRSEDTVSKLMARNFSSMGNANRFNGLAGALLERFKTTPGDYQQAVANYVPSSNTSVDAAAKTALSSIGNNALAKVSLSIRTRSGTVVNLTLTNQNDGLGVEIHSNGPLSATESQAIAQLSASFERAVQGFTADPPTVDIAGLGDYDSTVLSSIDLKGQMLRNGDSYRLDFHADASQRSLKMSSPTDQVDMKVNLQNPALWGSPAQREQAIAQQLQKISQAGSRGHGNAEWIGIVQDAFASMQRSYGVDASDSPQVPASTGTPTIKDSALLSGLADFALRITGMTQATNPMRLDETDRFDFSLLQTTSTTGPADKPDSIQQRQTSRLKANYHSALNASAKLELTSEKKSQSYLYTRIDDQDSLTVTLTRQLDQSMQVVVDKSAKTSARVQHYEMGMLVEDRSTP